MRDISFEVLMDRRENKKQCTVYPLRARPDFSLRYFDNGKEMLPAFAADILLHVGGEPLDAFRARHTGARRIATIDCTWKRLATVIDRVAAPMPKLVKIPGEFVTAYPRRSKIPGMDPEGGLATIEALFIAAAFLGKWDESLLGEFHFKNQFLELNSENWKKFNLR